MIYQSSDTITITDVKGRRSSLHLFPYVLVLRAKGISWAGIRIAIDRWMRAALHS